jgi:glycosyltransferase involved in cell wall biosynthesis
MLGPPGSPRSSDPLVSVLVNSYVRTAFLREAFDSVMAQTGAAPFEVVLMTALKDPPFLDEFQQKAGAAGIDFHSVRVSPTPVGGLARGVESARGEVIAILDDDDLWEPHKVATVQRTFAEDSTVGFFHNGQTFVDRYNQPISRWSPHRLIRHRSSRLPEGRIVRMVPEDSKAARQLIDCEAMFNNSSISFRRSILDARMPIFEQLGGGDDSFLFFCALASRATIVATTRRLTRYRLHPFAATAAGGQKDFAGRLTDYALFLARHVERVDLCQRIPPGPLPRTASSMLRRDLAQQRLLRTAIEGDVPGISVARETGVLFESDGFSPSVVDLFAIGLGLCSRASRKLTRAAFLAWRMAW